MPRKPYTELTQTLDKIKEIQARPAPNMNDVNLSDKAPHEYFVQQLRADYKDNMLTEAVSNALKTLPEEKQKEFIAKARGPKAEKDCTEKEWLPRLKLGNTWRLMDNKYWGRTSSEQLVDALAAVLPPEKMEELNTLAANLKAPDEPGYTGPLEEEPYKEKIQALKLKAAQDHPETAENTSRMLDEANRHLSRVSEEYREYLAGYDKGRSNNSDSLNKMNDWTVSQMTLRGQQTLAGGKFSGTFKVVASKIWLKTAARPSCPETRVTRQRS